MSDPNSMNSVLSEAKASVRDQISAAWQLQVDRIQEQLSTGWKEQIERVFEEGFGEIEQNLRDQVAAIETARQAALDAASNQARAQAEASLSEARAKVEASLVEQRTQWEADQARLRTEWETGQQSVLAKKEEDLRAALEAKEYEAQERVEQAYRRAHEAAREQLGAVRKTALREMGDRLNQSVRRLGNAADLDQWRDALLDGAQAFSGSVLLFRIQGSDAILEGARVAPEVQERMPAEELKVPLTSAPALANAVESKDMGVAVRTASEFSPEIANLAPESTGAKVYLVPVLVNNQVAAVLYTEDAMDAQNAVEPAVIELLANVAGFSLAARRAAAESKAPVGLVGLAHATPPAAPAHHAAPSDNGAPSGLGNLLNSLSKEEQELHLRAQRFARVQVAEMRLYKSAQVKQGRASQNLYAALREDIDLSREAFRLQFMNNSKSMIDYLHLELVHTLANDEAQLLGVDYPGPLALQLA